MSREEGHGKLYGINNKKFFYILIIIGVIIIDQITKFIVVNKFNFGSYPLIENFFYLSLIRNTGIAFGMFQGYNFLLTLIIISVIIIGGYTFIISKDKLQNLSLALILGGAIGNLIDRIRLGYIIDFIDFTFWPAFNFADSAVTIGAVLLFLYILGTEVFSRRKNK